tara:strand:+ start:474 stop:1127 length:654 start_codon:yes stop_codon:yes gene_type:complete
LAKRLSFKQKEEIIKLFSSGINVDNLSKKFNCTKLTIIRNLKKELGENQYKELLNKNKSKNKINKHKIQDMNDIEEPKAKEEIRSNISEEGNLPPMTQFIEIAPLNFNFDNSPQKDLVTVAISKVNLPKTVYMIVDKKIELEIKYLKEYPKWQFLSKDELERKTIEIYLEIKTAKSFCRKDQKVIKVPNTDVFKIVAPILSSRGISRIVSADQLIAL